MANDIGDGLIQRQYQLQAAFRAATLLLQCLSDHRTDSFELVGTRAKLDFSEFCQRGILMAIQCTLVPRCAIVADLPGENKKFCER